MESAVWRVAMSDPIKRIKEILAIHRARAIQLMEENEEEGNGESPRLFGWKRGRATGILALEEEITSFIRRYETSIPKK